MFYNCRSSFWLGCDFRLNYCIYSCYNEKINIFTWKSVFKRTEAIIFIKAEMLLLCASCLMMITELASWSSRMVIKVQSNRTCKPQFVLHIFKSCLILQNVVFSLYWDISVISKCYHMGTYCCWTVPTHQNGLQPWHRALLGTMGTCSLTSIRGTHWESGAFSLPYWSLTIWKYTRFEAVFQQSKHDVEAVIKQVFFPDIYCKVVMMSFPALR